MLWLSATLAIEARGWVDDLAGRIPLSAHFTKHSIPSDYSDLLQETSDH